MDGCLIAIPDYQPRDKPTRLKKFVNQVAFTFLPREYRSLTESSLAARVYPAAKEGKK